MCLLAVLGSQGIVVKYSAAIFFRTWIVSCALNGDTDKSATRAQSLSQPTV